MNQRTVRSSFSIIGKALHSGRMVKLNIKPASVDTGIVFVRVDQPEPSQIKGHAGNIISTELSTTIGNGSVSVSTVEHLMAAFHLLGVDNARVEIDGPELPILDGSALQFTQEISAVGLELQKSPRRYLMVNKPFEYRNGDQFIRIEPADQFSARCSISFERDVIGEQIASFSGGFTGLKDLVQARTFCHINEVNHMRQRGLALGGSLDNAIVVSDKGVINEEGLRSDDEFAQHKLLDLVGDLYLLGQPIIGKVSAHRPGHTLHANFMNRLLLNREQYLVEKRWDLLESPRLNPFQTFLAFG